MSTRTTPEGPSLFSVVRSALQDGAGPGDAQYVYSEAWDALDRLESTLSIMRSGMDEIRPDAELTTDAERWARQGGRRVIEMIEQALHV